MIRIDGGPRITRLDFVTALTIVGGTAGDLAKAIGVPRTYLSEFRHGERNLRPEVHARIRKFFEARGVKFQETAALKCPHCGEPLE